MKPESKRITGALLWVAFVSVPSILASGYVVYRLKEYLVSQGLLVNQGIYTLTLFVVMWVAMWATSRRARRSIFPPKQQNDADLDC